MFQIKILPGTGGIELLGGLQCEITVQEVIIFIDGCLIALQKQQNGSVGK